MPAALHKGQAAEQQTYFEMHAQLLGYDVCAFNLQAVAHSKSVIISDTSCWRTGVGLQGGPQHVSKVCGYCSLIGCHSLFKR
jgi:hypothetical protein